MNRAATVGSWLKDEPPGVRILMNLSAWFRKKRTPLLRREIALILLLKVVLLFVIWALWFDHPMSREQRAAGTARIILSR